MRFNDMGNLYSELHSWLSSATPGERRTKSIFKYYQKELWDPLLKMIDDISNIEKQTEQEKKFLKLVKYTGVIYRKQNYFPRKKGQIQFHGYYQSGSKNLASLVKVSNYSGEILLITTKEIQGINITGLLVFMYSEGFTQTHDSFKNINTLSRYIKEEEIAFPMNEESINEVRILEHKNILNSEMEGRLLEKSKWKRNSI